MENTVMDLDKKKAVYTVIDKDSVNGGSKRSFWVRIGAAFVNHDGSYTVKLDALPVNGMLHVRDWPVDTHATAPARTLESDIRTASRPQNADVFAGA